MFSKKKYEMTPVQVRLSQEMIKKVDGLIKKGVYPSRSEAIRDAVRLLVLNKR
jgi:Arc/MetJ-type ribon-helix-helix transcriptional regulator